MKDKVFNIDTSKISKERLEEFRKEWIKEMSKPQNEFLILSPSDEIKFIDINKDGIK